MTEWETVLTEALTSPFGLASSCDIVMDTFDAPVYARYVRVNILTAYDSLVDGVHGAGLQYMTWTFLK